MLYEQQQDRERERQVIERACQAWRCEARKRGDTDSVDFELLRDGEVKAYAEVKTRRNARRAYPTYCVDRDKWQALTRLHRQTGKPALLVVAFTDGLHYVAAEDQPYRVGVMERKDRGDPNDRDVVVHIPVGELRAIAANHGG